MKFAVFLLAPLLFGCQDLAHFTQCGQVFTKDRVRLPERTERLSGVATAATGEVSPFRVDVVLLRGVGWRFSRSPGPEICLPGRVVIRDAEVTGALQVRGEEHVWGSSQTVVVQEGASGIEMATGMDVQWAEVSGSLREVLLEEKAAQNNSMAPEVGGFSLVFAAQSDQQEDRGYLQLFVGGNVSDRKWTVHAMLSTLEFDDP